MSYTEIKTVLPSGEVVGHSEFRNSHGFGARIFSALSDKYVTPGRPHSWLTGDAGPLWALVKDRRLQPFERVVLALTFDRVWVGKDDVSKLPAHLMAFDRAHPAGVSHLRAIASALEDWDTNNGLAFHPMSVAEDFWVVYDDKSDDTRNANVYSVEGAILLNIQALEQAEEETMWSYSTKEAVEGPAE